MAIAIPAGISTLLTLGGIGLGIAGAVANTSATIAANNYQATVAKRNAAIMTENANRSIQVAQQAQIKQDQETRALLGEQIAVQSASGLKIGGKSQMLTRKSARTLGRMDALNVRYEGELEAYNYKMAAQDSIDNAGFLKQSNNFALLSGFLNAASIGVTGIGNLKPNSLNSLFGPAKQSQAVSAPWTINAGFAR